MLTCTKPIPVEVIQRIKLHLLHQPRELAWFQLSVNSAFRGGDILAIRIQDIEFIEAHALIRVREQKTDKARVVYVNEPTTEILKQWLAVHPRRTDFLFEGQRGRMRTSYWTVMLKEWCKAVGYEEPRTATHSCRKSFCKIQHEKYKVPLSSLMIMLNHNSEAQTAHYLGILPEHINQIYQNPI